MPGPLRSALRRLRRPTGFTLIELLVVILIVGILLAVAAPSFLGQAHKASDSAAQQYLAIAYRSAAAATVSRGGDFGGPSDGPLTRQAVADAINASEPELQAAAGTCPDDASSDPKQIIVSQAAGGDLTLCNAVQDGAQHTVWTLHVVDHALQPLTSASATGTGTNAPRLSGAGPSLSDSGNSLSHVQVGDVLTVTPGSWTNDPGFSYQWQHSSDGSSWTNVGSGVISYTVVPSDLSDYLRVVVTASNDGGQRATTSDVVGPVLPATPVNDSANPPTISDSANALSHVQVSDQLSADPGSWSSSPSGYSYRWQSSPTGSTWSDIAGASSQTYTVASAVEGDLLRVVVQATNAGGTGAAASDASGVVLPATPVNQTAPTFSGTDQVGQTLTAAPGSWTPTSPAPSYAYQWRNSSDGSNWQDAVGAGAQSASYTVDSSDYGRYLEVCVTASNSGGSASTCSSPSSGAASPAVPVATAQPTVTGTAQVGQALHATSGSWSSQETPSYAYQWQTSSDGSSWQDASGAGAQSADYTVASSDYDSYLRVVVTAHNSGGDSTATASAATARALPQAPSNAVAPTVSGSARPGQVLTATAGSWTPTTPAPSYAYQWQTSANGTSGWSALAGATASTYTAQASDTGNYLRVLVTATNSGGSGSAASAATAQVLPSAPQNTTAPSISGSATPGSALSVSSNGSWSNSPTSYAYQWQNSPDGGTWTNIAAATASSYTVALGSDLGRYLRVVVTAQNAGGSGTAGSNALGPVSDPGTTLISNYSLFGGARLDLSSTQTDNPGVSFPANAYAGQGYQLQVQFYGNYLENENCNGGCGHIYHYLQLVIGGSAIGTVSRGPSMGNGPSNNSGWITTSASGAITFKTWASAYENDKTQQVYVIYRYVKP